MGRRIQGQRRGRGGPTFRAPSHRYKARLEHPKAEDDDTIAGEVVDVEHDPARSAPVALVEFEDGDQRYVLVPEGVGTGERIQVGISAEVKAGNTLPLAEIPEGVPVCNVEAKPGDGGKFARASGVSADLITHERTAAVVQLPSGEIRRLDPDCRATIG
ncbi:MAG TPA: 50S ribosomal protein L2, partial [Halobacteriales archaeon]|nr:50S ribosomal protein L2 [Halobacteriales archaeon]